MDISRNLQPISWFCFLRETKQDIKNADDRYDIHIFISSFSCTDIQMHAYSPTYILYLVIYDC